MDKSNSYTQFSRAILASAIGAALTSTAIAQETESSARNIMMEEVVITAQKREAALTDTPIAVTALGAEQMQGLGINTPQDVAAFTPSMSYQEEAGGGEGNRIYLRGIGRETNSLGTEPGVGIYNNGFYTTESSVLASAPDRVERIEVLRGPQGTLYGRNTTGGAINVIAKRPGDEFEAAVRLEAGSYNKQKASFTASGPMTDDFGFLVHYSKNTQDSYYTNVSGADPIGADEEYYEAQLQWNISDSIDWNVRYFGGSVENETLSMQLQGDYRNLANDPAAPHRLGALIVNPELFAPLSNNPSKNDPFTISTDFQGKVAIDDQNAYQSTLTMDFEGVTVKLLNGYQEFSWYSEKDEDGTASLISSVEKIGQNDKTQQHEIQFISNGEGSVEWATGLFYFNSENSQPYALADANNPYLVNAVNPATGYMPIGNPDGNFYYQNGEIETTSIAAYGQLDWHATDALTLTAGLRYSKDEKVASEQQQVIYDSGLCHGFADALIPSFVFGGNPYADPCANGAISPAIPNRIGLLVGGGAAEHDAEWDAINWRFNAAYDLSDSAMVYGSVSTGYKPGGFRLGGLQDNPATPENETIVDNEELTAFEVGYKARWGESFDISAAAFYYDYTDMQVELYQLNPATGIVEDKLTNASDASIMGLELETTWAATDNLTLLANYSYLESEVGDELFIDVKTNTQRNVGGNELNRTPNNKATIAGFYVQPLSAGDLVLSANYAYTGSQYVSIFNDASEQVDSYSTVSARVAWQPASDAYEVSLFGANLTDTVSFANGWAVSGADDGVRSYGRSIAPRTYGLELAIFF
ncbi:TonB-dependent receptor [Umboniibacter marinipuniceus]|uniref:Iron complex outermembrane receptor protein n=1 Tax=Umboniibacter marinipuniceus TaxID=569599 RepID=A0A3M0ADC7_9GAMM|nr:TonB-dependent receptor [Umboniibacter marinipuniceus]RMA82536.1 iron complex outermembrane receptor protein [Umboniibacter marinipuniceus]